MKNKTKTAQIICPACQHQTEVEVPQNVCLTAQKCGSCGEDIKFSRDSANCCVVCEFSLEKCPMPNS